ncbi:MAG TPA: hypothetical protein PLH64_09435, partial [Anaerolineaceae bacterium]|nr:hypothetical protein [Anaerolineaceae bacterium]
IIRVETNGGNVTLPISQVFDCNLNGQVNINGAGQVSSTVTNGLSISGIADVANVTSKGSISVSSGQVVNSNVQGGGVSTGSNSLVSECTIIGGGISAGFGSTITHNSIENTSGTGISSSGTSTITFNRVVGMEQGIVTSGGMVENNLVAKTTGNGIQPGISSVRNNTLVMNEGNGIYLDQVPSAFDGNNFEFNTGEYDVYVHVLVTTTPAIIAINNWWGTIELSQIRVRTYDYYDEYSLAALTVEPILESPSQNAPGYVRSVTLDPESPVGIQTVNFTVEFSRPMDVNVYPQVTTLSQSFNTWITKTPMPTARRSLGVTLATNGKIYAIGGSKNWNSPLSVVEEYDPFTDTWTTKAPLPIALGCLSAVATNDGKVYAIGGSIIEEYDPITNTWKFVTTIPTERSCSGAASASNGKFYVIGGDASFSLVEEYNPTTDVWTTKSPMPTARHYFAVVTASNGLIYTVGGSLGASVVEAFDPVTNTWMTKSPLLTGRNSYSFGATAAKNGKIYAIGGFSGELQSPLAVVEEYDPITDIWSTVNPMLTPRVDLGAVTGSNGKIYAIGGFDTFTQEYAIVEEYTPKDFGLAIVDETPIWLDETHYQASYNFSTLNPRGDYYVVIENAFDVEGVMIAYDKQTQFTLDYAGEISDTTPPSQPNVLAWGNGSLTQLSGRAYAKDPDSIIVGYRYAIGTTPGGVEVVNWTNINQSEVTHTGLSLLPDQGYYVSFQARNEGGLWSPVGVSNPVVNGAGLKNLYLPLTSR